MSHEAVTWAMDHAPMLRTEKGRPDTTARHVLAVLAEKALKDGTRAYPSVLTIQYRTGYDRRTVQRALRRLEGSGLIVAVGVEANDTTVYNLRMELVRPASDMADLRAEWERDRQAAAERQRRSRARRVTQSASVTVTESVPERHASEVRDVTHSASARHARSAAQYVLDPSSNPSDIPADGRRPTTGSEGSRGGGSAALAGEQREEVPVAAVRTVIEALPSRIRERIEGKLLPAAVEGAIKAELARGLTAAQLTMRIKRRYLEFGIERDVESVEGEGVRTPVGALIALVRAGRCTSPRCDDGTDLDTGEECRTCERDREDRRPAAQEPVQGAFLAAVPDRPAPAPLPAPRGRLVARDCANRVCPNSYPAPADAPAGLCPECRESEREVSNA